MILSILLSKSRIILLLLLKVKERGKFIIQILCFKIDLEILFPWDLIPLQGTDQKGFYLNILFQVWIGKMVYRPCQYWIKRSVSQNIQISKNNYVLLRKLKSWVMLCAKFSSSNLNKASLYWLKYTCHKIKDIIHFSLSPPLLVCSLTPKTRTLRHLIPLYRIISHTW